METFADIEKALLGCVLLDPPTLKSIQREFQAARTPASGERGKRILESDSNAAIWTALESLAATAAPIDLLSVAEWLAARDRLAEAGGPAYLADLESYALTTDNAGYYARRLVERHCAKRLKALGERLVNEPEALDVTEAALAASEEAKAAAPERTAAIQSMAEMQDALIDDLQSRESGLGRVIPAPWHGYNILLGGFRPRTAVAWAGRYSSGKTSLGLYAALSVAQWIAHQGDKGQVLFVSLEETIEQLRLNAISCVAQIDSARWHESPLDGELARLGASYYADILQPLPLSFAYQTRLGTAGLEALMREAAGKRPLRLVCLDYLQKLDAPAAPMNIRTTEEWGHRVNADAIQSIAHDAGRNYGGPTLLLLVQEDFDPKQTEGANARLSKTAMAIPRFCRAIFGAVDAYVVLDRADMFDQEKHGGDEVDARLIVKKARGGKLGIVKVHYQKQYGRFMER